MNRFKSINRIRHNDNGNGHKRGCPKSVPHYTLVKALEPYRDKLMSLNGKFPPVSEIGYAVLRYWAR